MGLVDGILEIVGDFIRDSLVSHFTLKKPTQPEPPASDVCLECASQGVVNKEKRDWRFYRCLECGSLWKVHRRHQHFRREKEK